MPQPTDTFIPKAMRALTAVIQVLTGRQVAGRNLTVFPDDVFITSYPRSGNTWMRFLIANALNPDDSTSFANIERRIPEIYFHSDHTLRKIPRPRILKSHECFQPHYPRVVYIVRDPRDVAVSFYHHNLKAGNIPDGYPIDEFVPRFIAAEFDSKWGSWSDHVVSWTRLRGDNSGFLLLRYEDMKKDPMQELLRLSVFLKQNTAQPIDDSPEKLQRAIDLSTPERMRALERQQAAEWVLTKKTRSDKPFVRTATAGGWKSILSAASVDAIESAWGRVMKELGYAIGATSEAASNVTGTLVRGAENVRH